MRDSWVEWRRQIVALIRHEFREVLDDIGEDDVDWDAWRSMYDEGLSAREAVESAFLRTTS